MGEYRGGRERWVEKGERGAEKGERGAEKGERGAERGGESRWINCVTNVGGDEWKKKKCAKK